jgi:nitronate monooxygenase
MALPELLKDQLRIPLIGAPMFIVSQPELVIAQCMAGIIGAFPALNLVLRMEAEYNEARQRLGLG